jgi:hypothetical protein
MAPLSSVASWSALLLGATDYTPGRQSGDITNSVIRAHDLAAAIGPIQVIRQGRPVGVVLGDTPSKKAVLQQLLR